MSRFLSEKFSALTPYVPGEQPRDKKYIKLNTNESPYPPSDAVMRALNSKEVNSLRLYPDPECISLKEKMTRYYGVLPENIYLAPGSDDVLNFAFSAFCDSTTPAFFPDITYGFYKVFAELYGIKYTEIPLREDFSICPEDYYGVGGTIFIANPNAPTGIALSLDEIESILINNRDNVVVIDEAYVDFGGQSSLALIDKYDNLLVVRTFSKSRSLAGARLGYAFADKKLISDLDLLKYSTNPYNISRLTLAAGEAAICDNDYFESMCQKVISTRERIYNSLCALGFDVIPSKTNFLFAKNNRIDGGKLYAELKKRGVLVRHFNGERTGAYVRITIGDDNEMDILIQKIEEILEETK